MATSARAFMSQSFHNVHEEAARARKVAALATTAATNGLTADMLEGAADRHWQTLAECAGVRVPSPETRSRVLATLREAERTKPEPKLCVRCRRPVVNPDPAYFWPCCTACLAPEPKPALPEGVTYVEDVRYQEWSGEPAAVAQAAAERVAWAASPEGHAHGANVRRDTDGRRIVVTWFSSCD